MIMVYVTKLSVLVSSSMSVDLLNMHCLRMSPTLAMRSKVMVSHQDWSVS